MPIPNPRLHLMAGKIVLTHPEKTHVAICTEAEAVELEARGWVRGHQLPPLPAPIISGVGTIKNPEDK